MDINKENEIFETQSCNIATANGKQVLNNDEDENITIYGYKANWMKTSLIYFLYFLSLGLLRLIFHWFPTWRLFSTQSKCNLKIAEKVLVVDKYQDKYKSYYVEEIKTLSADDVKLESASDGQLKLAVHLDEGSVKEFSTLRAVWCKKLCFIWNEETQRFSKLCGLDKGRKYLEYHSFKGYTKDEQLLRQLPYGKNEIDIRVNSILTLLVLEALTPFYMFQVFSLIVWFAEGYYYYTIAIVIMSAVGITSSIIQTRRNQKSLKESVDSMETVTVRRGSPEKYEEIPSHCLVPGDLIVIPKTGCTMQCDAVLLNGTCTVNESMLTGESVPITKTSVPKSNTPYNVKEDSFHTLFCGTKIIQTRSQGNGPILAIVLRTGYLTTKGELVRSILYPPPSDFKFDQDSYKFIGILSLIAALGVVYTVVSKSERRISAGDIVIKALDLITIVIPPALPAAMTVGKLYAINRLKKHDIFCINSRVINVSGSIDCVCFDKTGTLTEDGLDMWGVVPVSNNTLEEPLKEIHSLPKNSFLLKAMATCHSLTMIDDELLGDPLDVKVFESTGWSLDETEAPDDTDSSLNNATSSTSIPRKVINISSEQRNELEIIRQYQFSSTLQRMSVIVKPKDSNILEVFCKGSPEIIISLSKKESVPLDINQKLQEFTEKGYRVIAVGTKTLDYFVHQDESKLERADVEFNLEFVGLIILENRIKLATPDVIKMLKDAQIKVVMITGDNMQTALSVAKECGIVGKSETIIDVSINLAPSMEPALLFNTVDQHVSHGIENGMKKEQLSHINSIENGFPRYNYSYAITGSTWRLLREHFSDQIPELVSKGVVFARMSGQQKQQLIQELQGLRYYVAMCGDGANDCGALRAAHVGISLSEEESSIASPFTSKNPDISCVPEVIREGRAALTTSIGVFKFMICYSLIQFSSVIVLYGIDSNLTSLQFLFIDICLTLHFMSSFGKTEAYPGTLHQNRPLKSLLSITSITSILLQMLLMISFQVVAYKLVQTYSWFEPFVYNDKTGNYSCFENYAVFAVSLYQYITITVSFSKGKPFRKPIYTNWILSTSLIVMTIICTYIILYPAEWITDILETKMPPYSDAGLAFLGLAAAQFACSLLAEDIIVNYFLDKKVTPKLKSLIKPRKNNNVLESVQNVKFYGTSNGNSEILIHNEISKKNRSFDNPAFQNTEVIESQQMTKL